MNPPISRVHLLFKTHLDLGFTDFARNVTARYFEEYIPSALGVARELRRAGGAERFVWTTGAWLIYEYLEWASPTARAEMEEAIAAGDIAWHGLPFTTHSELMDPALFRFGLSLSQDLDARYGKQTIAAKMTDVPGHTRGIVPLLAEAGIQFLHIGVNAASTAPAVPPVFVWQAPSHVRVASATEGRGHANSSDVLVMYHKGSYGDLQIVPGLDEAIAFAHTSDNLGPQDVEQVRAAYTHLREVLPGAEIVASTMDAFARKLLTIKEQLPVITQELGDTWIHGVGTDPKKVSAYRELLRLRHSWVVNRRVDTHSHAFKNFSRALLKIPEHTWGLDVKTHLGDFENYGNDLFDAARGKPNFQKMEASWQEQRAYLDEALAALGNSPLAQEARDAVQSRQPVRPNTSILTRVDAPFKDVETRHWQFRLDARGAIVHLLDKRSGRDWAAPDHPLALLCYETFSQADYDRFYQQYNVHKPENAWWSIPDFTKPGMASAGARHGEWYPRLAALYKDNGSERFLLELTMPHAAVVNYGCPATVYVDMEFPEAEPSIRFVVQWFDKRATRLPEAIWFSFSPRVRMAKGWTMDKLGQEVSPLDVIRDGNRHLHGVGQAVTYREGDGGLEIAARDAPLVAPGERSLLNFTNRQPPLTRGIHFLLYNNVWGTNFPMWYEDDARFEFVLRAL